jgi:hypothetical protein
MKGELAMFEASGLQELSPTSLTPMPHWVLPISDEVAQQAWQISQSQASTSPEIQSKELQWNSYLNQVALAVLMPDLKEDFPGISVWPNQQAVAAIWQFINGTVLTVNGKRLVLLPSKALDCSELTIPAEWMDCPELAGDYFLAVQIDSDEQLLTCWGYTTHQTIQAKGQYSADDRTYSLDGCYVIPDLSALAIVQQLNPTEATQGAIAPLAAVAPAQAENLLQRLVEVRVPRLEIPFALWGALFSDRLWRQRLAEMRQGDLSLATSMINATTQLSEQLSGWMQNLFSTGWQAVEEFFGDEAELAFAFRQTSTAPSSMIRRVKALRFSEDLTDTLFLLLMTIEPESDGRFGIQVQLRASERTAILPENLSLALISSTGMVVQFVQARQQDNAIQLPKFKSSSGTAFSIQVELEQMTTSELFVV